MKLREAVPSDADVLLELIREYYEYDEIPFDHARMMPGLRLLLQDSSLGRAWVLECGTLTAGYVIAGFGFDLEYGGRQATITDLYLRPDFRRQGAGSSVLSQVEGALRHAGAHAVELQVERDNAEARSFYLKNGFKPHDRIPMWKTLSGSAS